MRCCSLAAVTVNAQATSIWLEPTSHTINVPLGEVATLEVWADASDVGGILAGGLDMFYNCTLLTYNDDFAFDAAFPTDPAFSRTDDNCFASAAPGCGVPGEINGIAFGEFNGLAASGPTLVGTLSFTGLTSGTSLVTMADNDFPTGNCFATDGTDLAGLIDYGSAEINAFPLPAAAWLFGTGLMGMVGIA